MSNRFGYGFLTLALIGVTLVSGDVSGQDVELRDQFGVPGSLADNSGALQVVIVVSAKRLRRIKPWERALRQQFGDLPVLRVADVPRTSPTTHEQVASKLLRRLPPDLPVLIDLEGRWADRHGLDTSVPNLLLFAGDGRLIAREAGMFSEAGFAAFAGRVETALGEMPDQAVLTEP